MSFLFQILFVKTFNYVILNAKIPSDVIQLVFTKYLVENKLCTNLFFKILKFLAE